MKDKIIKLDGNKSYYVLEDTVYNNKEYVLATLCDLEKDTIDEENLNLFEVKIVDDNLVINDDIDDEVAKKVTNILIEKVRNS